MEKEILYTEEEFAKALELAAKRCNLDSHISYLEKKSNMSTWADRIIGRFFRKGMPVKKSFLYCNTLDADFFYLPNGEAIYTYSGYADKRDANEEYIVKAFRRANEMRSVMEETLREVHCTDEPEVSTQEKAKPIHIRYKVNTKGHKGSRSREKHVIYCGKCGLHIQRITLGDKYCRRCGTAVDWGKE